MQALDGEGGQREEAVVVQEDGAVLALLDDDGAEAEGAQRAAGGDGVGLAGDLGGLAVVDHGDVGPAQDLQEGVAHRLDPDVDGVGDDEGLAPHLVEDVELEVGPDVPDEGEGRGAMGLREVGAEALEDVELELESLAPVEVLVVAPAPEEGAAPFVGPQRREVDAASLQLAAVGRAEVMADDADQAGLGEVARGQGAVGGAAPEDALALGVRGLDGVVGHGADHQDGGGGGATRESDAGGHGWEI